MTYTTSRALSTPAAPSPTLDASATSSSPTPVSCHQTQQQQTQITRQPHAVQTILSPTSSTTSSNHQIPITLSSPSSPQTSSTSPTTSTVFPVPTTSQVSPPRPEPKWLRAIDVFNSPATAIGLLSALVLGIVTTCVAYRAWELAKWTGEKDFRDACRADRSDGIFSLSCNATLALPAAPPPLKRKRQIWLADINDGLRASHIMSFFGSVPFVKVLVMATVVLLNGYGFCSWLVSTWKPLLCPWALQGVNAEYKATIRLLATTWALVIFVVIITFAKNTEHWLVILGLPGFAWVMYDCPSGAVKDGHLRSAIRFHAGYGYY